MKKNVEKSYFWIGKKAKRKEYKVVIIYQLVAYSPFTKFLFTGCRSKYRFSLV